MIVMGAAGTAQADDSECVPSAATTLTEWSVDTPGDGFAKTGEERFVVTKAAVAAVPAVEEESHLEHEYVMKNVTQEYKAAVYQTEYEFKQREGQTVHWSTDPSWNAQPVSASSGFELVEGNTRETLVSPEIQEVSTLVADWFVGDPGSPWVATGETKKVVTRADVAAVPGSPAEGFTEFKWSKAVDAVTCDASDESDAKWVFVCKYVGTPGVDERLQPSKNNPISVSVKSLTQDKDPAIGDEFSDGQVKSVVIAFDPSKGDGQTDEPSIDDCPAPAGPSELPTPVVAMVDAPDCDTNGSLTVTPMADASLVVSMGGRSENVSATKTYSSPGTYLVTYTADSGHHFLVDGEQVTEFSVSRTVLAATGDCAAPTPTPSVDVCPNIGGDQAAVPSGLVKDSAGNCVAPRPNQPSSIVVADAAMTVDCDLDTVTTTVTTTTTDFVYDEDKREWVKGEPVVTVDKSDKRATDEECPPLVLPVEGEDVCPNIKGVQESVPDGMDKKRGECVKPAAGAQPGSGTGGESGGPVIGPDEVAGTEDARPHAVPTAVDAGLGGNVPALASSSPSSLLGQGLVGGGLMLLILAGAMQSGRTGRGAHQF